MTIVIIIFLMGFWKNVNDELEYLGKSRKELAAEAQFDVSYISKGLERNSIPIADTALRIARALDVSLEYLLDMPAPGEGAEGRLSAQDVKAFHKYRQAIAGLDRIPPRERSSVLQLIATLADTRAG